ncbi:hypothetical protein [Pedobacter flavus]|uniref:DUF2911 domain-containing protein n=1 Tax=Pedobacter flavus TaxID=3113906 RepID=A0ABU7GZE9_9SPHI|nr:hypothetical protein [Pedobacter sp. VNH31]MEE1884373.1 hypothetical protein [Pedobacter sp. VNH31]
MEQKAIIMTMALMLFSIGTFSQGAILDFPVNSATLNGKPTLIQESKSGTLSFAFDSMREGKPQLTYFSGTRILMDGSLNWVQEKSSGNSEEYYIWDSIDRKGLKRKLPVTIDLAKEGKQGRFLIVIKMDGNTYVYQGFAKVLISQ